MAVLISPGEAPRCTPEELAAQINALGQQIYEEEIFKGDTRYCNVTAPSNELHGFSGIREGYLQTRRLNDLSFFRMAHEVLTEERITALSWASAVGWSRLWTGGTTPFAKNSWTPCF